MDISRKFFRIFVHVDQNCLIPALGEVARSLMSLVKVSRISSVYLEHDLRQIPDGGFEDWGNQNY
jgi:hypothetical protein